MNDSANWIELLTTPLDVAAAVRFISSPDAGGIDIFLGTTRAESNAQGHALICLDYEAYESMALKQMFRLADDAKSQWSLEKIAILHRLGRVSVGEASVLIAVSSAHRAAAFEACRWIIDELKKQITIWKKEVWTLGEPSWIHPVTIATPF